MLQIEQSLGELRTAPLARSCTLWAHPQPVRAGGESTVLA